ncbi:putative F-box protein At1g46984 [Papaver somniferum]|uniref:putative F-box protein At1g46984 n=1 Tax=Papaver somniferum TaxID=3469 RepID=UPI000E6F8180|nr:putative F-box protein At1g46984 [Papaver somniferum]
MKGTTTSCIDDQILCEILSRLPLKSLVRFKRVCKSWQSLIEKDQWLIKLHHRRQLKTSPHLYFLTSKAVLESPRVFIVNLMVSFPKDESVKIEIPCTANLCIDTNHKEITTATKTMQAISNKDLLVCQHIQKPINGMICLIDKIERKDMDSDNEVKEDHAAGLYNVITKEATPWIRSAYLAQVEKLCDLSKVDVYRTYEFGFDPTTREYKVICMWSISGYELPKLEGYMEYTIYEDEEENYKMCEALTLGSDTAWRRIDKVPPSDKFSKDLYGSVYANGSIYWMYYNDIRPMLVAFDVGREDYRVMPDLDMIGIDRPNSYYLMELDGHLVIVKNPDNHTVNLWILDDDCDKNTSTTNTSNIKWTKEIIMLPICWSCQYVRLHAVEGTEYSILELSDVESDKPRYRDSVFVHSYNRKTKTFSKIEITGDESANSFLGANIGHPSYKFTMYVESLLTLQRSYR